MSTSPRRKPTRRNVEPKDWFEPPERKRTMREWIVVVFLAVWGAVLMSAIYNWYMLRLANGH